MHWMKAALCLGVAGASYHTWQAHQTARFQQAQLAAQGGASPFGFLPVQMPEGASRNVVLILAPLNCPSKGAQRADALAKALDSMGIPNRRSNAFSANIPHPDATQLANLRQSASILGGDIPAVFVNGMGKSNPTAEEIAGEFQRTR